VAGERIKGETALAYSYFELYRDMPADSRSHAHLCSIIVEGKKRGIKQVQRWSSDYNWKERIADWDIAKNKEVLRGYLKKYGDDFRGHLQAHMVILKSFQMVASRIAKRLSDETKPDVKEFRQAVLGYQPVGQMLNDLLGIFSPEQLEELLKE
jgi:hypothetical protein